MSNILAIDDDIKILRLIKNALELSGHTVDTQSTCVNINPTTLTQYDLLLLDVMMPDMNGFEFCKKIRESADIPILFLTAKTDENAVVEGLLSGGDDYIKKPFGIAELNARVDAHLRRENRKNSPKILKLGNILIFLDNREITVDGHPISLTKNQYDICVFLASNRGKVFSKEQIYDAIYDLESNTLISTITEHIRVIRNKFKDVGCNPIDTIWGVGYKWK